jgi:hypothetical protein
MQCPERFSFGVSFFAFLFLSIVFLQPARGHQQMLNSHAVWWGGAGTARDA